ncbi:MAG: DUF4142 domain-containing protein [Bdellovibrionota bacterium]
MNSKKQLLTLTATLSVAFFAADASALNKLKDRIGSNSFSDEPRGADSPGMIMVPPTGYPGNAMSTSDSGGNGMAKLEHFDAYTPEYAHKMHHARNWENEDRVVYHSAAPSEHYFAVYGEDIPALRGLQLETALNRLHHINRSEIALAKMAETQGKSEDFLNLAHEIRADHELLERKVLAVAQRRNITLESFQLATYEKAVRDRLAKLKGMEFETAFLRVNERGHEEAARSLRMVRNDLTDTEVRGLINESIPRMMAHMSLSNDVNRARARAEEGDLGE